MSRVLAVLVAIGMVAGAIYIRARIDDDGGGGGENGNGVERLVCDPSVAVACEGLADEVVIQDAAATANQLIARGRQGIGAWLAPDPWPLIVDAVRESAGQTALFPDSTTILAATRLSVVGPPELEGTGWGDLGRQVGSGDVRLGWRDPASGLGVLQLGAFATGYFGRADFATNDFDAAFRSYLEALVDRAEVAGEPLERRLAFGGSFAEAVVELESDARGELEEAAPGRRGDLGSLYPEPVVAVGAALVGDDDAANELMDALDDHGWDEAKSTTNLPSPGVLAALWEEVRR